VKRLEWTFGSYEQRKEVEQVAFDRKVDVNIGRAAYEACSATWDMDANSAFDPGPRKTTKDLDLVD
jgi:hypothetical protein